jgi:hypothetical protein
MSAWPTHALTDSTGGVTSGALAFTEIVYQPTGPDITRELEAFITAARAVLVG